MHDAAELLALRIHHINAARAAAIDIAGDIHLHAVGHARLRAGQVGEYIVGLPGQRAVRRDSEGANMAAPRVIDVEDAFIGREWRRTSATRSRRTLN